MTPTPEQEACYEAATSTSDNLLISALAGAAKTTTLVGIAERLPTTQMLFLAFNKTIQIEMSRRLPENCTALTLNGLGHRTWADAIGRRLVLNKDKVYGLLRGKMDELSTADRAEMKDLFPDTLRAIEYGKSAGYIPDDHYPQATRLMNDENLFESLDEEPNAVQMHLIREVSLLSLKAAWQGEIDFNDQILMPTVFPAIFPRYPVIGVDEAQDLSALNHAMLHKLVRNNRLIAVGDECQAIYGFRGAHEDSMSLLRQAFDMRQLTLSTSFRCPRAVVLEARSRAPHMQWPEWAIEGTVTHLDKWSAEDIPSDAVILCRNNAPLFTAAIALLKNGRAAEVRGNDIGKYLLKVMRGFGDKSLSQEMALGQLAAWRQQKLAKSRDPGKINDQAACIHLFLKQGGDLGQAIAYAEHIFAISAPIKLMTIHKSKGLEFPNIFILDEFLLGNKGQERNLRYVAQTRAKETLTYVRTEDFVSNADSDEMYEGGGSTAAAE